MAARKKYSSRKKSTRGAGRSKRVVSRKQKSKSLKRKGLSPKQKAKFAFLMSGGKLEDTEE